MGDARADTRGQGGEQTFHHLGRKRPSGFQSTCVLLNIMTAERPSPAPAPAPGEHPVLMTTPFYPLHLKYSRKEDSQEKEMGEAVMSANTF